MDPDITQSTLVQAIRRSLRGIAKRVLISLDSQASPHEILHKLDALFGEVATHGMVMQEFFNAAQKPEESAATFGCRLESLIQTAIDNRSVGREGSNDLLRHKFWTSLYSDRLKSQTRHKYDAITSFDELLREIRVVEKELDLCSEAKDKSQDSTKKKKAQSHNVTAEVEYQQATSLSEVSKEFDSKLKALETKLTSQIDAKFDKILEKLDSKSGQSKSYQGQGRGQGHGRGRGNFKNKANHNKPKTNDSPKE